MDEIKETPVPEKKSFVQRHKVAITVVATSACWIVINRIALKEHNDFLKENGLYEKFMQEPDEES